MTILEVGDDELLAAWMQPEFIDAVAKRMLELGVGADHARVSDPSELLTVAEVARRLNVSQQPRLWESPTCLLPA